MKKFIVLAVVIGAVLSWWWFGLGDYFTLAGVKAQQASVQQAFVEQPFFVLFIYFVVYVLMAALSLPGAALLTLLGGAVFGLFAGTLVVSFASTTGATLAMLMSRTLLHDWVAEKFRSSYDKVNAGIDRDGAFYLFTLRLIAYVPFFAVNLVMGLTRMPVLRYYWVSQLGMLPGTLLFVYAGQQLGEIESVSDIFTVDIALAFILLAIFPWIARFFVDRLSAGKAYRGWHKPKKFDRNIIVIGGGAAGLVTSYIGAAVKAKVSLIEAEKMGGDCLNTGCVPSKALIRSARIARYAQDGERFGLKVVSYGADFPKVMARVKRVIAQVAPHDSVERYSELGVDCIQGHARITSPWTVEVNGRSLSARNLVIATGGRPKIPAIPGLQGSGFITSDSLWGLADLPEHLLVMGGGPIGCELAQAFRRLGSEVTIIEFLDRILSRDDEEVSETVQASLSREGIRVLTGWRVVNVSGNAPAITIECAPANGDGDHQKISGDQLLVAVGREGNAEGLGLDALGLTVRPNGTIESNEYLQTRYPNIYVCGDIAGPYQFTHVAGHQAWYAAVNALFGFAKKFAVDYSVVPFAVFTDPEVARVGLNETEAKEQGIAYELTRYDIDDLDRAIADDEAHGFIKVLTQPGKDRILGVTIVGYHASELIAEYVLAMKHGLGLNKILGTIHAYPTLAEANKYVAGEWKRAHAPQGLLKLVEKFHRWRL